MLVCTATLRVQIAVLIPTVLKRQAPGVLPSSLAMPQPLPNNLYVAGMPAHQVYATCLALEAGIELSNWSGPPTPVCARLLGYMIIHSPTNEGRSNIVTEINSCLDDDVKLHELAKFYVWHYLRCCKCLP